MSAEVQDAIVAARIEAMRSCSLAQTKYIAATREWKQRREIRRQAARHAISTGLTYAEVGRVLNIDRSALHQLIHGTSRKNIKKGQGT